MPATFVIAAAVVAAQVLSAPAGAGGRLRALAWTVGGLLIWAAAESARRPHGRARPLPVILAAALLAVIATRPLTPGSGSVAELAGTPGAPATARRLVADLLEPPRMTPAGLRAVVEARAWLDEDRWRPVSGRIRLAVRRATRANWRPGTRVVFDAALRPIENFGNPGELDWRGWNARRGVFVSAFVWDERATVRLPLRDGGGLRVRLREAVSRRATQSGHAGGALVAAVVVGDRSGLDDSTKDALRGAGLAHLLAISGFHLAVVAGLFLWLMRPPLGPLLFGGRGIDAGRVAATGAAAAVLLYAAVSGGGVSVVRATVMSIAALVVLWHGGSGRPWRSLAAAAILVAVAKPGVVVEAGFQLSFAATSVLLALLDGRTGHAVRGKVAQAITVCFYCSLVTWPIVAHHFYRVPVWSPAVNFVAAVPAALMIALGLVGAALLPLSGSLSSLLLASAAAVGDAVVWLAQRVCELPGAPLAVVDPGAPLCWLLVGLVLIVARKPPRWRLLVAAGAVGAVLLGSHAAWMRWRSDRLDAVFLSVGHGDASIVRLPGGRVAVIDGGGRGRGRLVVGPMLRRMRIARIDYLIVSHVQSDHWPGALELAREFSVGELWYSGGACSNADFREALARLRESGTRIVDAGSGDPIVRSGLQGWLLRVLWPPGGSGSCDDNDRSLVVEASFAGTRILWTGDIEETAEHRLARRVARADILKVAHHGSHTSSSAAFLAAVAPSYAVVSVSKYNRFGLPDEKVLARLRQAGARILRTDRDGAITAAVTAAGPSVNPAKRL